MMPRGKRSDALKKADPNGNRPYYADPKAEWGGYVNLRITEDERQDFDNWAAETGNHIQGYLDAMLVAGLKVSISYDAENSCYVAAFTGCGCMGDKARYCLVARGVDYTEAVALAVYKHDVLLDGDWGAYTPANGRMRFG